MELFELLANNFLLLLNVMSIYLLIGLLLAGVLKQIVSDDFISKYLGKSSIDSVIKVTILGIPLSIYLYSIIPLSQGLRKEGINKGAIQSFLISIPINSVDSILVTFSFFGFVFTVFRVVSSVIIAITVGLIQNFVEKSDKKEEKVKDENSSCHCSFSFSKKEGKSFSIKEVFIYAYVTLFKNMVKPLFIGLILGALFTTFVPKEYSYLLFNNQFLTYLVIILFSMPLYVCATASLPLAAAFMLSGMSGGATFIFLTVGPAISAVTMSVIYKLLGKTSLIIYIATIALLSLVFGFLYDMFFSELNILKFSVDNNEGSICTQISSLIILVLISFYSIKSWFERKTIKL